MASAFDAYDRGYAEAVAASVSFSGLKHDFFLQAKVDVLAAEMTRAGLGGEINALDVGCGVGVLHPHLAPRVGRLTGVDVSEPCILEARRRRPEVDYQVCLPDHLPFTDGVFDLTLTSCVLHHVPVPARAGFVAEMKRVTRPGGLICIIEHSPWHPLTRLSVLRCPFDDDAVLLRSRSAEKLLVGARANEVRSRWFLMAPFSHSLVTSAERLFAWAPFGAQYATFARA